MPGNPLSDPNWAPDVVDLIDKYVGKVRATATDNAVKASRAVVFGVLVLMAVMVATPLFVILALGVLREILGFFVDHAVAVYLSYYVLGAIFMIAGFFALHMRHKESAA